MGSGESKHTPVTPTTSTADDPLRYTSSFHGDIPDGEADLHEKFVTALNFAAFKHRNMRSKNLERTPYINHLLAMIHVLVFEGHVAEPDVLQAALLSSVISHTDTTLTEVEQRLGRNVRLLVAEVTEDKSLPVEQRKKLVVEKMARGSQGAKLIKLAYVLQHMRTLVNSPPGSWPLERFRNYFMHVRRLMDVLRGTNVFMESAVDEILSQNFLYHGQLYPVSEMEEAPQRSLVVAVGIPFVDFALDAKPELLEKFGLKPGFDYFANDVENAEGFFDAIKEEGGAMVNAGGAAFSTLRVAQWFLREDSACVLAGTVGKDAYSESIRLFADHCNVRLLMNEQEDYSTAIRTSVTCDDKIGHVLRVQPAASDVVVSDEVKSALEEARVFLLTAIAVYCAPEMALYVAKRSLSSGKMLAFNVEGAALCNESSVITLEEVLSYVYCAFGDERSFHQLAHALSWEHDTTEDILLRFDTLPKLTDNHQRAAFVYLGDGRTMILANGTVSYQNLPSAGSTVNRHNDWVTCAASGGFVSQLALGKNFWACVNAAQWAMEAVCKRSDLNLPRELYIESAPAPATVPARKKISLEIFKMLPKAELHCHLDGSVRVSTVLDLAREQKVELPTYDEEELRKLISVDADCPSLVEYLRGFGITLKVMQKKYAITRCMYEVCEDAYADGVRYLEVRFSPILHVEEGLSLSGVMDAVCEGAVMAETQLGIIARIIVCGMRHLSSSTTEKLAEIAWRYKSRGVVAFDLAGPEDGFSSKLHKSAFQIVRENLLNCTLHSGEAAGWESVHDSIHHCGARRIGHGVRMRENPKVVDYVVNHRIPVESCVTSNLQTKAVASLKEHPFREYFDRGVVIVPCTDNVTVSSVTLSNEYFLIQEAFDMTPAEIVRLIDYGFRSAFLELSFKKRLRAECLHRVLLILKNAGYTLPALEREFAGSGSTDSAYSFENLRARASVYFFSNFEKSVEWGYSNPKVTLDVVRALPKPDVHCRLDGSVSIPSLWEHLQKAHVEGRLADVKFDSEDALRAYVQDHEHSDETDALARECMLSLIQTTAEINSAVIDVIKRAEEDNVKYLELHVRPLAHRRAGLSADDVVRTVLDSISSHRSTTTRVNAVLYVDPSTTSSKEELMQCAKIAVKYAGAGVVGFLFSGTDGYWTDSDEYMDVFDLLHQNGMDISVSAGRDRSADSVIDALQKSNASRISGGYLVHRNPAVMEFLANYSIPVELGWTKNMRKGTRDVHTFAGNVFRLYIDNEVRVTACSFDLSLYPMTRSECLLRIIEECRMEMFEVLDLLATGIRRSFLSHRVRKQMFMEFWTQSVEMLERAGFRSFRERHYFPSTHVKQQKLRIKEEEKRALRYLKQGVGAST